MIKTQKGLMRAQTTMAKRASKGLPVMTPGMKATMAAKAPSRLQRAESAVKKVGTSAVKGIGRGVTKVVGKIMAPSERFTKAREASLTEMSEKAKRGELN